MIQPQDLTRPPVTLDHDSTLVVVIDMSQASWLVAAIVPGVERRPLQKLKPDHEALLRLLARWRDEAAKAGKPVSRTAVAYEAGRDGFWLARWLQQRGVEAHVIHPNSVAVSREGRRSQSLFYRGDPISVVTNDGGVRCGPCKIVNGTRTMIDATRAI